MKITTRTVRFVIAPMLVVVGVLVILLSSCDSYNDSRGRGDAPIGDVDEHPRKVYEMPDKYGNVAVFCDGANEVYVMTADVPPVVVADSSNCPHEAA